MRDVSNPVLSEASVSAGGIDLHAEVLLEPAPQLQIPPAISVERVGDQIWLGTTEAVVSFSAFESVIVEDPTGLLLVGGFDEVSLLDPDTLDVFQVGSDLGGRFALAQVTSSYHQSGSAGSTRYCATASSGAHIHTLGPANAAEEVLGVFGAGVRTPAKPGPLPRSGRQLRCRRRRSALRGT